MAVYTQVPAEALAGFLARFDVGTLVSAKGIAEGVENSNYLVDTTRGRYILTLYERRVEAGDLPYFLVMLDHLAARGNPVPPAVPDRTGELIHVLEGRPACLIRFLPGVSLSRPTPTQALAAGRALGRMHRDLADFAPARTNTMGIDTWRPLLERCGRSVDAVAPGLYDRLDRAIDGVAGCWQTDGLARGTIHADLFPDNVLMQGDSITGLIDFYFACTDLRAFDLAITHTAWSFDAAGQRYHAGVGEALVRGYEEQLPLSPAERAAFASLAVAACIRFTLSRAWDWLNTPADALVTRKDPLSYWRRAGHYDPALRMDA